MPLSLRGFGGGMQAVLGNFVNAAERRIEMDTIEVIQWAGAFADVKTVLNGLGYVGLGKHDGVAQGAAGSELRGDG